MLVIAPPTLTAAGLSPDRADRATFVARSIARDEFIKNTQIPQLQTAIDNVFNNATVAFNSGTTATADATAAATSASQAASAATAIAWVSGTTYAIGDARWSPIKKISYRRLTAGAGTTDPSADATNWAAIVMPLEGGGTGGALYMGKNKLLNPNFAINARAVSGTVVLAAGAYGHNMFKAGAGGCTYTFATALNVTTITISAGTLMQVIEGINLFSGTHTLSWTGTATARIDAGSYSASGVTGTAVGGTNQTCEWGTGTVSKVQYEPGTVATAFEQRHITQEQALCQRYLPSYKSTSTLDFIGAAGRVLVATDAYFMFPHAVPPRVAPTGILGSASSHFTINASAGGGVASALTFASGSTNASRMQVTSTGMTVAQPCELYFNNASAYLLFTGCEL